MVVLRNETRRSNWYLTTDQIVTLRRPDFRRMCFVLEGNSTENVCLWLVDNTLSVRQFHLHLEPEKGIRWESEFSTNHIYNYISINMQQP